MSTFPYHHDLSRVEEGCIIRFLASPPGSGTSCWGPPRAKRSAYCPPCAGVVGSLHATDMDFGRPLLMDDVSRAESAIWHLAEGGCKGKLRENAGGRWRLAKKHKGRRPGTMGTLSPLGQNIYAFHSFGVVEHIPA